MYKEEFEFIILSYLEENNYTSLDEIRKNFKEGLSLRGVEATDKEMLLCNEIIWDLICDRILTPGINSENIDLPYVNVSNRDRLNSKLNADRDI